MVRHRRPAALLAVPLLAAVLAVQPAAAFSGLGHSGKYYVPQVMDDAGTPGATCIYKDRPGTANDELDRIVIHQFFTHAPYPTYAKVGFQLIITRNAPPVDDHVFVPFRTITLPSGKANQQNVAFFDAAWKAPAGVTGRFRAILKLSFSAPGGDVVKGTYRGRIEAYEHKLGTLSFVDGDAGDPGACAPRYPQG